MTPSNRDDIEIIDVRPTSDYELDPKALRKNILCSLSLPPHHRSLPGVLLYDERGLRLFDDCTVKSNTYYLFPAELEILKNHGDQIAQLLVERGGCMNLVELGAGSLRKTSQILLLLARVNDKARGQRTPVTYHALDLEKQELERTLTSLHDQHGGELESKIHTKGLWGTYDSGLKFIRKGGLTGGAHNDQVCVSELSDSSQLPLHILFLGSSISNFSRPEASSFLRGLPLHPGTRDTLLLGLDHDNGKDITEASYNDPTGHARRFYMNGLRAAGRTLGDERIFDYDWEAEIGSWEYFNRYDDQNRRNEAFLKSTKEQSICIPGTDTELKFETGELVKIESSY